MTGQQREYAYYSSVLFDHGPLDNIFGIVPAFHVDIRSQDFQERPWIVLLEYEHAPDTLQRIEYLAAIALRLQRSPRTFEPGNTRVAVDPHNQHIPQQAGLGKIPHMTHMQNVKAPIGGNERLPFRAQGGKTVSDLMYVLANHGRFTVGGTTSRV